MKKAPLILIIFISAGVLLWAFAFFSTALSAPTQVVDLVIGKSDYPDPVLAGNALTYTLAITNSGDLLASGVAITDTLPPGQVSFNGASPACNYDSQTGKVRCDLASLEALASTWVTITVQVSPSARGIMTNTASANTLDADIDLSNNTVTETTTINASANLDIYKSDTVDQVTAGENVSYSYAITVTNLGPSLATGVVVTDTWLVDFTRGPVEWSQGICYTSTSTTDFSCDIGNIPVEERATITATYSVPAETPAGIQTNTVEASSAETSGPKSASHENTVVTTADLGMVKSDGVDQVTAGDGVTYHYAITVTNGGPSLATGVVVTDTWPSGFERGTVDWSQGGCNTSTSETDFTCTVGDIPVGEQATITATYSVLPGTPAGMRTNIAEANGIDASGLITATDATSVIAEADLSLTKLDNPDPVIFGDILAYTLNVANAGPSNAVGVIISDTLPAGTAFDAQSAPPECSANGSIVTCSLGTIPAGGNDQVVFRVNVLTTGTLTNRASVHASTDDLDTTDNSAQAVTTVQQVVNPPIHWTEPVPTGFSFHVDCETVHLEVIEDVPVQRVEFQRWDHVENHWIPMGSDYSSPYTRELDSCVLPYGENQIWAWAYDALNHRLPGIRIFLVKLAYLYIPVLGK